MQHTTIRRLAAVSIATGALLAVPAGLAFAQPKPVEEPAEFTSSYSVPADAAMVPGEGGEPGATGTFNLRINSELGIICHEIILRDFTPPFESPAATATHLHEGATGVAGPARVVFANPEPTDDGTLVGSGCQEEPFMTGSMTDAGGDSGEGFTLAEVEADPAAFYVDAHNAEFVPGAVRGQLTPVPTGGVETGAGGTADDNPLYALDGLALPLGVAALGALLTGLLLRRRALD